MVQAALGLMRPGDRPRVYCTCATDLLRLCLTAGPRARPRGRETVNSCFCYSILALSPPCPCHASPLSLCSPSLSLRALSLPPSCRCANPPPPDRGPGGLAGAGGGGRTGGRSGRGYEAGGGGEEAAVLPLTGPAGAGSCMFGMLSIDPGTVLVILTTTRIPDRISRTGTVV